MEKEDNISVWGWGGIGGRGVSLLHTSFLQTHMKCSHGHNGHGVVVALWFIHERILYRVGTEHRCPNTNKRSGRTGYEQNKTLPEHEHEHEHIYIYTNTCIELTHIHIYSYMHIHIYTYIHIHIHTYTYIHIPQGPGPGPGPWPRGCRAARV